MTDQQPLPQPAAMQSAPSNGLGMAGFVVSLVGLVMTCGLLCPVGFILSLFGLRKEPRGFAIAGAVIGGIGSIFAAVWGLAIVATFMVAKTAIEENAGPVTTTFALLEASRAIQMEQAERGRLPTAAEGNAAIEELRDGWERPLQYEPSGDAFTVRSAGPDGVFGNADDETQEVR